MLYSHAVGDEVLTLLAGGGGALEMWKGAVESTVNE